MPRSVSSHNDYISNGVYIKEYLPDGNISIEKFEKVGMSC
jgi:hypothetical protein